MHELRFVVLLEDADATSNLVSDLESSVSELVDDENLTSAEVTLLYSRTASTGTLVGLRITLEGEDSNVLLGRETVVESMLANGGVKHVLSLSETLVQEENARVAARIYQLEARLRESLSVLMLTACEDDYYGLLKPSQVSTHKDMPRPVELKQGLENEFSYISFSDYRHVINRKMPTNVPEVIALISGSSDFDELRAGLTAHVIAEPSSANLIASLTIVLDPIEKARNAVAHNRRLRNSVKADFERAADQLDGIMDDFFAELNADQVRDAV